MIFTLYVILLFTALPIAVNGFIWWCKSVARFFNVRWTSDDWGRPF